MFSSEITGSPRDEKAEEACRPTFQTPLRMKAASSGFLGKPKASEDGNRVRDDGPALPSLLLKAGRSETTCSQQTEQPATANGFVSAPPMDGHATGMVIHDEDLSWTTESTVTGLAEVIASLDCEIANKGENESVAEQGSNSDWTSGTDSDDEGWILDKVARRRNISSVRSVSKLVEAPQLPEDPSEDSITDPSEDSLEDPLNIVHKDSLEGLLEDLLECPHKVLPKVSLECSAGSSSHSKEATDRDQVLPNQEGECLDRDSAKADGDSRVDLDHGDFQAEVGQDSVDHEVEGVIDSRPLVSDGRENEDCVDLKKEGPVDSRLKDSDSDTRLEADVDVWIEEARIEAEILIASYEGSFPRDEGNSEVQSDVFESNHEAKLEGSDVTVQQREKIDSAKVTSDPNSAGTVSLEPVEINLAKIDSREDEHADMNLAGIHSTEENENIDISLSEMINSKETSSSEINATETNFTEWQSNEIVPADECSAEPTCAERCVPVVTAVHNFPDAIYGVTQPDSCSAFSNSTTAVELSDVDVFELTLPGTQTVVKKSAETQTEFDNTDSMSAASHSSKTPSSFSSYGDSIPGDWCSKDSSNSSEMETAKMELADSICDLDTELELIKNFENSNFPVPKSVDSGENATDPPKTEEELSIKNVENSTFPDSKSVDLSPSEKTTDPQKTEEELCIKNAESSNLPDTEPVELSDKSTDPQKTEEEFLPKNLESSQVPDTKPDESPGKSADPPKNEEEKRSEDKSSAATKLILTVFRYSLGIWVHFWGPPSYS